MTPAVDIWWTRGTEASATSDATINCRAATIAEGVPVSWRRGERRAFLDSVLAKYGAKSKSGDPSRHLSLSDSGTHLAVGVGRRIPVGIDIERQRPVDDALQALRGLGLSVLATRLGELPPAIRNIAFLSIWTAFEAFLKLERLKWELGAVRFAAMAPYWMVSSTGQVEFRGSQRTGLFFWHAHVPAEIVACAATPRPAEVTITKAGVAAKARFVCD